jgi:diacylglycerol O-acyltransferase
LPQRELAQQFGPLDAVFLNFERKEMPLHIGSVSICAGPLPFDQFVAGIQRKLDLLPRYRQKAVRPFLDIGLPTWQDDPKFDIRRHIFHVKLDAPAGEAQLRELTGCIFTELLDRDKPLWEVYIVDGLAGGRSAILTKVHHCMVDGVSGVALLNAMFDATPDTSPETPPVPKGAPKRKRQPPPQPAGDFTDTLKGAFQATLGHLAGAQKNLADYGMSLLHDRQALTGLLRVVDTLPQVLGPLERSAV